MSVGVNDCCVEMSPIAEPDRGGNTIKLTALFKNLENPRLTDDPCIFKNVYRRYRSKLFSTKQHQQRT